MLTNNTQKFKQLTKHSTFFNLLQNITFKKWLQWLQWLQWFCILTRNIHKFQSKTPSAVLETGLNESCFSYMLSIKLRIKNDISNNIKYLEQTSTTRSKKMR